MNYVSIKDFPLPLGTMSIRTIYHGFTVYQIRIDPVIYIFPDRLNVFIFQIFELFGRKLDLLFSITLDHSIQFTLAKHFVGGHGQVHHLISLIRLEF